MNVDILTLLRIILQRWYVVVPCLLVTAIASWAAYSSVAPRYKSEGALLLLNPGAQVDKATGKANPYVGNLFTAANVVTVVLNSRSMRLELLSSGVTGEYVVFADPSSNIVTISAEDDSPAEAVHTTRQVLDRFDTLLLQRQRELGVPDSILVTSQPVTAPSQPIAMNGSRLRAALALFAVGIAFTMTAAFAVEGIARRHRPRTARRPGQAPGDHGVVCPLCDAALSNDDLLNHLRTAHPGASNRPSDVYPLSEKRSSRP